ncbi:hypothetical protein GCM10009837_02170 [Streptomyces durmitorensis]|uniref:GrpB family protein n=1 Tax=Streptomyces durmitorensis TaxID=319947 RepID=A0ABY4Q3R7_9ACTN|nr:GrpB family protein [Streptomyces durmitorensis]UQT59698.1 GrpB family protein [Streptomyces durmitorensis]
MPFPDEAADALVVVEYRPSWPTDFSRLASVLRRALGDLAVAVDHVGSTSVPGLAAKDCVDVQVRVDSLDEPRLVPPLTAIGFRLRPEPWNHCEVSAGHHCPKLVFAPRPGARRCNVHLREDGRPNARYALLFRDYLRASSTAREAWGAFKQRLALSVPARLADYGQMEGAERWAAETGWEAATGWEAR